MPAQNIEGIKGCLMRAALSGRFEGKRGFLLAAVAVAMAFSIRFLLQGLLDDRAMFTLFMPAILVASIAGGIWPGSSAVVMSLVGAFWLDRLQAEPSGNPAEFFLVDFR